MKHKRLITIYSPYSFGIFATLLLPQVLTQCTFTRTSGYCIGVRGNFFQDYRKPYIENLYIVNSDLSFIEPRQFSSFENLKILHFDNCTLPITDNESLLAHLKNIEELELRNLNLPRDIKTILTSNRSLKKLSLHYTGLMTIRKYTFKQFHFIETIDISNNLISEVEEGSFDNLPHLKNLNMAYNMLGLHFQPAYLSLPSGGCEVCGEECSQFAAFQCLINKDVDILWQKFGNKLDILNVEGNPLCTSLDTRDTISTRNSNYESKLSDSSNIECTTYESNACTNHLKRKMFFLQACNQTEFDGKERDWESTPNPGGENSDEPYGYTRTETPNDDKFSDHDEPHSSAEVEGKDPNNPPCSNETGDPENPASSDEMETETPEDPNSKYPSEDEEDDFNEILTSVEVEGATDDLLPKTVSARTALISVGAISIVIGIIVALAAAWFQRRRQSRRNEPIGRSNVKYSDLLNEDDEKEDNDAINIHQDEVNATEKSDSETVFEHPKLVSHRL